VEPHAAALLQLADDVEVIGGWSPSEARREAFTARYGIPTVASDAALLGDPRVEAVLVLTPPRTHAEIALRAAAAGKHVLVEKPLTVERAEAVALVDAFERADLRLGVVFQHRFREAPMELRAHLAAGALGRLLTVSTSIPWWRPPSYF